MRKKFSVEQIVGVLKQAELSPCSGADPEGWDYGTDLLSLEGEVCRPGSGPGTPDQAASR
jgi:hypothetical protein